MADGAGVGFGFTWQQISKNFKTRLEMSESELRRELNDLVGERLVAREMDDVIGEFVYTLAARGRDFKRGGCPWDRIDEFS